MDEINNDKKQEVGPTTELLVKTLRRGGCDAEMDEDGFFVIAYNDIDLSIQVNESQRSLTIYDLSWYNVNIYDAEAVIHLKSTVNYVNSFGYAKLVYHEDDDDCIYVSTLFTFPFNEELDNIEFYFSQRLSAALSYRQAFIKEESKEEVTQ